MEESLTQLESQTSLTRERLSSATEELDTQQARAAQLERDLAASGQEAQRLEPALGCDLAMYSPSTGIIDAHALMHALHVGCESILREQVTPHKETSLPLCRNDVCGFGLT